MKEPHSAVVEIHRYRWRLARRTLHNGLPLLARNSIFSFTPVGIWRLTRLGFLQFVRCPTLPHEVADRETGHISTVQPRIALLKSNKLGHAKDICESLHLLHRQKPQRKTSPDCDSSRLAS